MEHVYFPVEHRYVLELAVMNEMTGWTITDVNEAPADLIEVILYRRGARRHWEDEAEKWKALDS